MPILAAPRGGSPRLGLRIDAGVGEVNPRFGFMATALVTGANRGIGLELCRQLGERKQQVIAVCRSPSVELQALGVRVEPGVDVTDVHGEELPW